MIYHRRCLGEWGGRLNGSDKADSFEIHILTGVRGQDKFVVNFRRLNFCLTR